MTAAPANTLHWDDEQAEIHKVVGPYENNVFVHWSKQNHTLIHTSEPTRPN